jgi:hypothetical protein
VSLIILSSHSTRSDTCMSFFRSQYQEGGTVGF